ncbi:UDP-2,3-diacylglucosamine diphosphatase [Shewanella inventionis]|uniref:UDP-2,3-diacylglucosamine hydrolase n=1 Tax=Shewanella inventionis TaxID=1738770 RepID=A0ABQ1JDK1_9GAMM|nr:UDP-2,3-diacylglucosamine diphosphatase [Shewanella inventionis]MCL1158134.1 UDP-2,3-diacylglucosamine diphosphatase [Shewanella inventionis]UAL42366.1 UDP-2,3-diacylglucosamine diphosphatase [Shewanella inventionis]GGB63967.1 UDP-2,3-diacylglucosamine hydrolase [Shewanella inventionis]
MKRTVFVGDLHLSADRPDITLAFLDFLEHGLDQAQALYIIGDLFEVWMGDDIAEPFTRDIAKAIKVVSAKMPVYFIHGNRDFMVGRAFCKQAGMKILPEVYCIDLYGTPTVILHGDSLCTLDKAYQRFRQFRSISAVRWIYANLLPKQTRLNIAAKIRQKSVQGNQHKQYEIMDVESSAVDKLLDVTHCQRMIHGHTHRPDIHHLANNKERVVVGDWYTQGSVLSVSPQGCELQQRPFTP